LSGIAATAVAYPRPFLNRAIRSILGLASFEAELSVASAAAALMKTNAKKEYRINLESSDVSRLL
jgi:hypothetical protein